MNLIPRLRLASTALAVGLIVSACASVDRQAVRGNDRVRSVAVSPHAGAHPDASTAEQCAAVGGWWTKAGNDTHESCVDLPKDSGRTCKNDEDCQAFCLAPADAAPGDATSGTCATGLVGRCGGLHVKNGRAIAYCVE